MFLSLTYSLAANEMFSVEMKKKNLTVGNLSPQGRSTSCSKEVASEPARGLRTIPVFLLMTRAVARDGVLRRELLHDIVRTM